MWRPLHLILATAALWLVAGVASGRSGPGQNIAPGVFETGFSKSVRANAPQTVDRPLGYRPCGYGTAPGVRLFLQRDPAGFVDGTNLYSYVSNNPLSRFDPQGLTGYAITPVQAWGDPEVRQLVNSPEYKAGFQRGFGSPQGVAAGFGLATAGLGWAYGPVIAAWGTTPAGLYTATETVSTGIEIGAGYDGPPIVPGPGDLVRAGVQGTLRAGGEVVEVSARKIALGVLSKAGDDLPRGSAFAQSRLGRFARSVGAADYRQWEGYDEIARRLAGSEGDEVLKEWIGRNLDQADEIHFNLAGFSNNQFKRYKRGKRDKLSNVTNWEYDRIISNEELLKKTTFYDEAGEVVPHEKLYRGPGE